MQHVSGSCRMEEEWESQEIAGEEDQKKIHRKRSRMVCMEQNDRIRDSTEMMDVQSH